MEIFLYHAVHYCQKRKEEAVCSATSMVDMYDPWQPPVDPSTIYQLGQKPCLDSNSSLLITLQNTTGGVRGRRGGGGLVGRWWMDG